MFRRNRSRQFWLIVLAVLAFAVPAAAQDGSAQGVITDATGKPVEGAKVTLEFINNGRKFETKSEKNGQYLQIGLLQGAYTLTVEKDGIGKVTRNIQIRGARRNSFNVVLAPGAGEAAAVDPKLAEATKIINEGVGLSQAGNQDEAIAKFNEALALNPKCVDCYYNIGAASAQKKDYDKAIEAYNKSIELKPTAEAYSGLANVYNAQRKFDEATAASKKAAELSSAPGASASPEATYNQGVILFNQGKAAEAMPLFESVVQAQPNNADAHYMLGMTMAGTDPTKAVTEFETYLKLAPTGKNAPLAKQFVDALKK